MKRILSMALASLVCASAMAQYDPGSTANNCLWGVKIYSKTVNQPPISGGGSASGAFGVDGGGCSAGQITALTGSYTNAPPPAHPIPQVYQATSSASISASLLIQAYWYGFTPPSTLYINDMQVGSAQYNASWPSFGIYEPPSNWYDGANAYAGAVSVGGTMRPGGGMKSGSGSFYIKTSHKFVNRVWVKIAMVGPTPGVPIWKLTEPTATDPGTLLTYSTSGASANGDVRFTVEEGTYSASCMSNAGLGLGYTVSTQPLPEVSFITTH